MPDVKLYYFTADALGEPSRLLLAYGGQEFTEHRYTFEECPAYKAKIPYDTLPVLEIDGKQYAQNVAIARYLGRKYDLAGNDDEEAFEIDQNVDCLNDIHSEAMEVFNEKDKEAQEKKHEENSKDVYPDMLESLHAIVEKNKGHLAAGKLTWGDFVLAGWYAFLKGILRMPDFDEKYPGFKKLTDSVYSIPKVKAFADAAPPSV